jgi:hypothetical protein
MNLRIGGVNMFVAAEQQEAFKFTEKEFAARRIGKSQGRQGVDDAMVAGVFSEQGFNADNGDNDFGRNAVLFFRGASAGALSRQNCTPASIRASVRNILRYLYQGKPSEGEEILLSMSGLISTVQTNHQVLIHRTGVL